MLEKLQKNIHYLFKDQKLLHLSLTHKSYKRRENNERLEFLGDAVVDLIVGEYLYSRFDNHQEGKLSQIRASIVNEEGLAMFARDLGIQDCLYLSNAEESNNGRNKPSILADALEALVGAIFLESGFEEAKKFLLPLIEKHYAKIDFEKKILDYKTTLQELTQSLFGEIPQYVLLQEIGPDHQKFFEMAIFIQGKEYAKAIGASKKQAQQECAKLAYKILKKS
ncbi:ribonuclease III [Helicobacter cholecystus]|uniref:ribonuclease III n=1 Tax=Helicobacter cholecystus TaxID=45498 RepID=UPI00273968D9|nr:ribonuclease III [Helicobacter cholecystus]